MSSVNDPVTVYVKTVGISHSDLKPSVQKSFQMGDQLQRWLLRGEPERERVKPGPLQHVLTQWRKEDKFKSTSKQLIRLNCICCILSAGENLCLCMQFGLSHGQWSRSSVFNVAPTSSSQINKVKQTIKMVINSSRQLALCQFK